jgi:hypothetical protein
MKNYTYTSSDMETCKTYDGDIIIFDKNIVTNWVKEVFNNMKLQLSEEEKLQFFQIQQDYPDVLREMWGQALFGMSNKSWTIPDEVRNPIEEYENFMSASKDEDFSDEEHQIKELGLREYKEWYEKQIK